MRRADFVFVDPPYSTHIRYTEQPECIGTLDAAGDDGGEAYYDSMTQVISEDRSHSSKPTLHGVVCQRLVAEARYQRGRQWHIHAYRF